MGWCNDNAPGHEGWIVGLVQDRERGLARNDYWRELASGLDPDGVDQGDEGEHTVRRIQVGCDCGWRSRLIVAPYGTTWSPSIVWFVREEDEDALGDLWSLHVEEVRLGLLLGAEDACDRAPMVPAAVRLARRLRDLLSSAARTAAFGRGAS